MCTHQGRNRKKFFWRGKVIFPEMLFPGRKFPFWLTQNKFQWFLKVKSKKQNKTKMKKKKRSSPHFVTFPPYIFNFPPYCFNFPYFSPFSLDFLAPLFPVGQQKFQGQKSLGGTLPPAPPPACYATGGHWALTYLPCNVTSCNYRRKCKLMAICWAKITCLNLK